MHVEAHCKKPKSRKLKVVGALWACSCGNVWRRTRGHSMGGAYWTWELFADADE